MGDLVKIDWTAVGKFGIPGVIAMFLVWKLADGFDMFEARLRAVEQQHADLLVHTSRTEDLMGRAYMSNERVLYVLRQMCVNDAKTTEARRLCLEESR